MGQYMLGLVFYTQDIFQASARQIGFLAGLFSLFYAASCMAIQFHLHRIRPGLLVASATLLVSVIYIGILLVDSMLKIYWLVGLTGIAISFFWPPISVWLFQGLNGAALNRRITSYNMTWSLGSIIGPLICGYLSERTVRLPLLVSIALMLLATGLVVMRLRRDRSESRMPISAPGVIELAPTVESSTPYRFPAWVGLFAVYFCLGVAGNIFPPVARSKLLFTESLIGLLLFFRPLLQTVGFYLMGHTTFWHFRGWPMLGVLLLGAVMMIGLVFAHAPVIIGGMFAGIGLACAAGYAISIFHCLSGSTRRSGRVAIHEGLANAGIVAGAMIGGAVCQAYSIKHAYWLCVAIALVAVGIQSILLIRIRGSR